MRRSKLWIGAVVGILAGGIGIWAVTASSSSSKKAVVTTESVTTSTTTTAKDATTTTDNIKGQPIDAAAQKKIDLIIAFVEKNRGLKFKTPPVITLLSHDDFVTKLKAADNGESDLNNSDGDDTLAQALGIIKPKQTLKEVSDSFFDANVIGFYDPQTKQVYVKGTALNPYARATLAHELTHYLQDEYFGIDRKLKDRTDESDSAFTALIEGDAVRIQHDYEATFTEKEQEQFTDEELAGASSESMEQQQTPFGELAIFPYIGGESFAKALYKSGGNAAVDNAFRKPPTTTEQVLHFDAFSNNQTIAPVPDVTLSGHHALARGVLGEITTRIVLIEGMSVTRAREASTGWGGDRYVSYKDGAKSCATVDFVMDTPTDLDQLKSALQTWSTGRDARVVDTAKGVELNTCVG